MQAYLNNDLSDTEPSYSDRFLMSNRFKDNKLLSFLITFLGMAAAFIAFYVFFDWFYCIAVKKEAFVFVVQRHVVIPAVLALVYTVVMQTKVFDKDKD